ncbi:MAG: ABC transporter permease [Desulfobacterales bacterium]|nr:ABC transporter permease [Desulfobacterales bacterium]
MIYKTAATILKELLLLSRDRTGLLVLFVMPALLVLVMTLVQENVLKTMGESNTRLLLIDHDGQEVGQAIEKKLLESGAIEIIKSINGKAVDEKKALARILKGDFQLCVIIPEGTTAAVKTRARQVVRESLAVDKAPAESGLRQRDIAVYFDPTVFGGFRSAVLSSLELVVMGIELDEKMNVLSELLPVHINGTIRKAMGPMLPEGFVSDIPGMRLDLGRDRLLRITERSASQYKFDKKPTSVQQNVPAWALFGIFFIAIPMAGALIKERHDETLARLLTLPVSFLSVMMGKIIAYVLVCFTQLGLIVLIGKHVLPLLRTPVLDMGSDPVAVMVISFSAVLAATGFGILLGTIAKTYEQASMAGPIAIVVAAALGGIMVPVYAMPKIMQEISRYSPLAWGHDAFLDVFVRGGSIRTVSGDIIALLSFFVATVLIAWICFMLRSRN